MKNLVYKDGRWIERLMPNSDTLVMLALRDYAFIDSLADISNTNAQKATYKFLDNEVTHRPWFLDAKTCTVSATPKIHKERDDIVNELHLATEACTLKALSRWIDWMKTEGIFDNTMIIFVSDHDSGDSDMMAETFGRNYGHDLGWPNPLLLVKHLGPQFNEFKISNLSLMLADIPLLVSSDVSNESFNGRRQRLTTPTSGKTINEFVIRDEWKVTGDMQGDRMNNSLQSHF